MRPAASGDEGLSVCGLGRERRVDYILSVDGEDAHAEIIGESGDGQVPTAPFHPPRKGGGSTRFPSSTPWPAQRGRGGLRVCARTGVSSPRWWARTFPEPLFGGLGGGMLTAGPGRVA